MPLIVAYAAAVKSNIESNAKVFNVLNAGTAVRIRDLRLDLPNFGIPAQLQLPRQARIVVKWTF